MGKIGVIQFPGSNCEYETIRAIEAVGGQADLLRWNVSETVFHQYEGYVVPGGFSYQDRVRSGAIAAKLPIISYLIAADLLQKPILGICNGCQILAESGLSPNTAQQHQIEMALTPNEKDHLPVGFLCQWVFVKIVHPEKSVFTPFFKPNDVLPIVMSHAEGRFVLKPGISSDELTCVSYCNEQGEDMVSQNGSFIAGLCNPKGNVMAIMPHPERVVFSHQLPFNLSLKWAHAKEQGSGQKGPWEALFKAMVAAAA